MFVFVPMSDPIPSTYPWMDAHVELVLATTATVAARLTKNIVILLGGWGCEVDVVVEKNNEKN